MRRISILGFSILLASCSISEELPGIDSGSTPLLENLENIVNGYELSLKGYTLEEINEEKDEDTPTQTKETIAPDWLIKKIQEATLDKSCLAYDSKTRTDARPYGGSTNKVGVFKYGTCGNNREFVFLMDCEDGGHTRAEGNIGDTYADGNVVFRFCLVDPGNYGGGTLLLYNYQWSSSEGDVDIIRRYHDNEDKKNTNRIMDNGGLASTGLSVFTHNTLLFWRFSDNKNVSLPFQHGVLTNRSTRLPSPYIGAYIYIDDENKGNVNEAILWKHRVRGSTSAGPIKLQNGERYRGITVGTDTEYDLDTAKS